MHSLLEGVITSAILFFIPFGAFYGTIAPDGTDMASLNTFNVVVATSLIFAVTRRVNQTDLSFYHIICSDISLHYEVSGGILKVTLFLGINLQ